MVTENICLHMRLEQTRYADYIYRSGATVDMYMYTINVGELVLTPCYLKSGGSFNLVRKIFTSRPSYRSIKAGLRTIGASTLRKHLVEKTTTR